MDPNSLLEQLYTQHVPGGGLRDRRAERQGRREGQGKRSMEEDGEEEDEGQQAETATTNKVALAAIGDAVLAVALYSPGQYDVTVACVGRGRKAERTFHTDGSEMAERILTGSTLAALATESVDKASFIVANNNCKGHVLVSTPDGQVLTVDLTPRSPEFFEDELEAVAVLEQDTLVLQTKRSVLVVRAGGATTLLPCGGVGLFAYSSSIYFINAEKAITIYETHLGSIIRSKELPGLGDSPRLFPPHQGKGFLAIVSSTGLHFFNRESELVRFLSFADRDVAFKSGSMVRRQPLSKLKDLDALLVVGSHAVMALHDRVYHIPELAEAHDRFGVTAHLCMPSDSVNPIILAASELVTVRGWNMQPAWTCVLIDLTSGAVSVGSGRASSIADGSVPHMVENAPMVPMPTFANSLKTASRGVGVGVSGFPPASPSGLARPPLSASWAPVPRGPPSHQDDPRGLRLPPPGSFGNPLVGFSGGQLSEAEKAPMMDDAMMNGVRHRPHSFVTHSPYASSPGMGGDRSDFAGGMLPEAASRPSQRQAAAPVFSEEVSGELQALSSRHGTTPNGGLLWSADINGQPAVKPQRRIEPGRWIGGPMVRPPLPEVPAPELDRPLREILAARKIAGAAAAQPTQHPSSVAMME